ncbi:Ubiquitin-activating enzyme E1 1 [Intoshia linei]|uniref:E1 ubiquitin-activating enzyme n=1 Tax=Intoshia linei TaxID=1819745 RepID=A0A177AWL0_9BILA|nr:Ubiquitin-activating enzyme E1 1 [Intoshia linei]
MDYSQPAKKKKISYDMTNGKKTQIDDSLYSRQLYVLGHEAMQKMSEMDILVSGLGGLGVEVAKDIILAGVKSVTLQDTKNIDLSDMATQFYATEKDIGKNRAVVSHVKLSILNEYVNVKKTTEEISEDLVSKFKVVVLTSSTHHEQLRISQMTRKYGVHLVIANTCGLFGQIFNDFGKDFTILDVDGNKATTGFIASISNNGIVTGFENSRHSLETGDFVKFSEIKGLEKMNNLDKPFEIKVVNSYSFSVGDISQYGEYISGGVFTSVKMKKIVQFSSYQDAMDNPEFVVSDFAKMDRMPQLHLAFKALSFYLKKFHKYPSPFCVDDAKKFLTVAQSLCDESFEIDRDLLTKFAHVASGNVIPMTSVIGSITAQEVLKACTSKFSPIKQFFYFDAVECIDDWEEHAKKFKIETTESNNRYNSQMSVFGFSFQEKIKSSNVFVIGAGAIGCEMLKNLALMGVATNEDGMITITDMDSIELSNLNRQFLFRYADVQKMKSSVAAEAIVNMNNQVRITPKSDRVGEETENVFHDTFFEKLDFVVNALDNVDSRLYMDRRCVYYLKPMIDSGTLGTKGNTQVVIPHLTESYGSSYDPPEKSTPMCTIKNFPFQIDHTIQWSRALFEDLFKSPADSINQFLMNKKEFFEQIENQPGNRKTLTLDELKKTLIDNVPEDATVFVHWARELFDKYFNHQIGQLLYNFPPKQVLKSGNLFWSSPKRCPVVIKFDCSNTLHTDFIYATANIYSKVFCHKEEISREIVIKLCETIVMPEFVPKAGVKISTTDAELDRENDDTDLDDRYINNTRKALESLDITAISIKSVEPQEFEKDDLTNFHMDFILATANLRAVNYSIETTDHHNCKRIAGNIIPAIATTTSLVAGLASLEIYKIINGCKDIDKYKNGFVNLALPLFAFSNPIQPPLFDCPNKKYTLWDSFKVTEKLTLKEFLHYFKKNHGYTIKSMSCGPCSLYMYFMASSKKPERLNTEISDLYQQISQKKLKPHVNWIVIEALVGESEDFPYIKYKIN